MGDDGKPDRRQRLDAMLKLLEQEGVEVEEIAGNVQLDNLTATVGQVTDSPDDAFEEHSADVKLVARVDERIALGGLSHLRNRSQKRLLLKLGELVPLP